MTNRKKLFSVTIADCRVDTFTVGGNGGSGKDTSNTGVRVTHEPSGAVGRSTDTRSQLGNKEKAFRRMGESKEFQRWARMIAARLATGKSLDDLVEESMKPDNIKVETKDELGMKWIINKGVLSDS